MDVKWLKQRNFVWFYNFYTNSSGKWKWATRAWTEAIWENGNLFQDLLKMTCLEIEFMRRFINDFYWSTVLYINEYFMETIILSFFKLNISIGPHFFINRIKITIFISFDYFLFSNISRKQIIVIRSLKIILIMVEWRWLVVVVQMLEVFM